ncbi:MAG: HAMP domain-containing sensor histidine kinase [Verrucomicrobiota bacterium]|nr:HAMP domain-containing sensor histidine kinase [Verrucomicrobiota bacterium]MDD8046945.1 HAMP domain-containing sensor histidine kinase [Verrucomicrobiota bacterium]MDD8051200.1 HAMP domain-containing sensor histidine kinase [Verrucomicrobiota bacterium]
MDANLQHHISAFAWQTAPMLVLCLDPDGSIRERNAFANLHLGEDCIGKPIDRFLVDFVGTFNLQEFSEEPAGTRLINLQTASGSIESFNVEVRRHPSGFLLLGKPDWEGMEVLQDRVMELNRDLTAMGRSLHKANAELKELNTLKNQFLGMAAHDLRKPISVVLAYAGFLQEELGPSLIKEQAAYLQTILDTATRMGRLVDQFLTLSIIETGRLRPELQPVSVREVVKGARVITDLLARRKGVEVQVDDSASAVVLSADPTLLEQAVINLVSNAIEHSSEGQTVCLTLRCDAQEFRLGVRDEAGGIPEDQLPTLFAPFSPGKTKKSHAQRGTGLGLAITRAIADAHHGRIEVQSNWGYGSSFELILPIHPQLQG